MVVNTKIDQRAKKILFDMRWSSSGWKIPASTPNEQDYAYAKSKGFLFDDEVLSHLSTISYFRKATRSANRERLRDLFVSSLSNRLLHIRPGLPAFYQSKGVTWHLFSPSTAGICKHCGMFKKNKTRYNAWNFSRYKWGNFDKQNHSLQNPFILNILRNEPSRSPTRQNWTILRTLIESLNNIKSSSIKAADIVLLWKEILPSNKQERELLFETFISMKLISPSRVSQQDYDAIPRKSNWTDEAAFREAMIHQTLNGL